MTDIAEQLQGVAVHLDNHNNEWASRIAFEAVNEIEWLRAEVARLEYILGISTPVEVNP